MTTTYWIGNQAAIQQQATITVSGTMTVGGTVSVTINGKTLTYTLVSGDTTTTVASGLLALLQAAAAPPEFAEITWTSSAAVITGVALIAGTPFMNVAGNGLVVSSSGGPVVALAQTVANSSPSDVSDPKNWNRSGVNSVPQNGDDVVLSNSSVPLLWNADALAAVQFNSLTVWQDFTGSVGLPENNPLGYVEWRGTYFRFSGPSGRLSVVLGEGQVGSGPTRQRYNVGGQATDFVVLNSGGAQDAYAIRLLGSNSTNTLAVVNTSVGVAMLTGETSALLTVTVGAGALLALGSGVSWGASSSSPSPGPAAGVPTVGVVTVTGGALVLNTNPATLNVQSGGQATVNPSPALTYNTVMVRDGSSLTWASGGSIQQLNLFTGSNFDKSPDPRALTVTNASVDATCRVNDPYNAIAWTNPATVNGAVTGGVFLTGPGRTFKLT